LREYLGHYILGAKAIGVLADIDVLILHSNDLIKLKEIIELNSKCANNLREICFLEMVESIVMTMEANINEK
jgi:hypothetical protein